MRAPVSDRVADAYKNNVCGSSTMVSFVDVFCGAGGWTEGLTRAGLTHVLGIDLNAAALETYRANHVEKSAISRDVCHLSKRDFQDALNGRHVDIVVGSPPCTSFSLISPRRTGDAKDHLYQVLIRIADWCSAQMVVIENVNGFKSKDSGAHYDGLVGALNSSSYVVTSKVVNVHDFEVPQNRKRLIVVAHRPHVRFHFPSESPSRETMRDILQPREEIVDSFYWMTSEKTRYYIERRRNRPTYLKMVDHDRPALTLLAGYMKNRGAEALVLYDDNACRMMTELECAKIQTFSPDYRWCGSRSAIYSQIGNAVPPKLSEHIGLALMEAFGV
jgi:DNA (cytosine-5)-methyltransferase 1